MKTVKLRYKLVKMEKALVFQVLEMDERFRNGVEAGVMKFNSKKASLAVVSSHVPEVYETAICLRGEGTSCDLEVGSRTFDTNEERDECFDKVQIALADWAENWEGFKEDPKVIEETEPDTFVV